MTRITIWETPDNREQYRDVPCEYKMMDDSHTRMIAVCNIPLLIHAMHVCHPWRIYRDAEQPGMWETWEASCASCSHPKIRHQKTISRETSGCIDCFRSLSPSNWKHEFTAAPATAAEPATGEYELTLPETVTADRSVTVDSPTDAGVEREQAARLRTSAIRRLSSVVTDEVHRAFVGCHGTTQPCHRHIGLRLCVACEELPNEVHFHNEAIV